MSLCATKAAEPSTSVALNAPPVDSAASVSVRLAVAVPVITAASLVPAIVTLTDVVVPSAAVTVKLSDTDWPTLRLSKALLAV